MVLTENTTFMTSKLKISFCTVCMNRMEHLQQTLPKNIEDNLDYDDIEFVILDYNSSDGLGEWVQQNLEKWQGKVNYYRTNEPTYYVGSHARNMAFKLAKGNIVCNLDADNFAGKGFAAYINEVFSENDNIFLEAKKAGLTDILGKICFQKTDFEQLHGYDEQIKGYGFEDHDIKNRLANLGRKPFYFSEEKFLKVIEHSNDERVKNEFRHKNLFQLFIRKENPFLAEILLIYKDFSYETAKIIDNYYSQPTSLQTVKPLDIFYRNLLVENSYKKGSNFEKNALFDMTLLSDEASIIWTIYFFSQILNKSVLIKNLQKSAIAVNEISYGEGTVFQNFDTKIPIKL